MLISILDFYRRPFGLALICFLLYNFSTVLLKTKLTLQGVAYFFFCNDKKWPKQPCPSTYFKDVNAKDEKIKRKTLIFVRHGESTWNDTFNKGAHRSKAKFVIGFIPGLVKSLSYEFYLLLAGKVDSWFYDSPLSYLGLDQVKELCAFLRQSPEAVATNPDEKLMLEILRKDPKAPKSILVSSSLRRALSTVAASFQDRLARNPDESILIIPSLQEISRNPDTLSITPAQTKVAPSWIDESYTDCDFATIFGGQVDMHLHRGNKPIDTNGYKRMKEFCNVAFSNIQEEYIIIGGHSIWFRSFFKEFLPRDSNHVGKSKKLVNCGAVALDLLKINDSDDGNGVDRYMVDEKSIRVIYGGFK